MELIFWDCPTELSAIWGSLTTSNHAWLCVASQTIAVLQCGKCCSAAMCVAVWQVCGRLTQAPFVHLSGKHPPTQPSFKASNSPDQDVSHLPPLLRRQIHKGSLAQTLIKQNLSNPALKSIGCRVSKAEYSVLCQGIQVLMSVICLFFVCQMRRGADEGSFKMRSQYWEDRVKKAPIWVDFQPFFCQK